MTPTMETSAPAPRIPRPRILYLAWTAPTRGSGANLALHRHFIQRRDLDLFVITDSPMEEAGVPTWRWQAPRWVSRLRGTRLVRWVRQFEMLFPPDRFPPEVEERILAFRPDLVFTVPDNTLSWTAWRWARRLGIPLVTNFQDWWPRGQYYHAWETPFPGVRQVLERRFRRMHRDSRLVFCTSPGMQAFLGHHPNSHVLYPICEVRQPEETPTRPTADAGGSRAPFTILYTGTPFGSYGRQLLALMKAMENHPHLALRIYGARPDWSPEEIRRAEEQGVYRGYLPFEQLAGEMRRADAFLVVMSFDPELEVMMRTSFTTKFLDYASFGKPIVVWGPGYCGPVQLAQEKLPELVVTDPDPSSVVATLEKLKETSALRERGGQVSRDLRSGDFNPDRLHRLFVDQLRRILNRESPPGPA